MNIKKYWNDLPLSHYSEIFSKVINERFILDLIGNAREILLRIVINKKNWDEELRIALTGYNIF